MNIRCQENVGSVDALTSDNAAILLIDRQVGLMQLVRDLSPEDFKNNVVGLAKTAKPFGMPIVLTTTRDYGPNTPMAAHLGGLSGHAHAPARSACAAS